jgi:hypothetical protein
MSSSPASSPATRPSSPALTSSRHTSSRMPEASDSKTLVAVSLFMGLPWMLYFNYTRIIEMIKVSPPSRHRDGTGRQRRRPGHVVPASLMSVIRLISGLFIRHSYDLTPDNPPVGRPAHRGALPRRKAAMPQNNPGAGCTKRR